MTTSTDDFKGMEYYQVILEWKKPDGSQVYVKNDSHPIPSQIS
jgi:hypothetical protein